MQSCLGSIFIQILSSDLLCLCANSLWYFKQSSWKLSLHISHLALYICLWILFLCFLKEGKLQKIASHSLQASSTLFPTCNSNELLRVNFSPHFSHVSPICSTLTCLLNSFPFYCNSHNRVLANHPMSKQPSYVFQGCSLN